MSPPITRAISAIRPLPGSALDPVADGVLDQRLNRHRRHDGVAGLLGHVHGHVKLAEPGPFQPQIALHVVELLGQRHVGAPVAEQVAGELGEVDQQLARLLRPRVDIARHRRERVVDEMRGDLCAQRAQLGLREPLLLVVND